MRGGRLEKRSGARQRENWAEGLVGPVGGDGTCVNDDIGRMAKNHL